MSRRTVRLYERRARAVRLPRAEVDFLLAHARHLIDLTPTLERGSFWLAPRGCVGFLDGPTLRYAIEPKIPWPNLCLLLGLSAQRKGDAVEPRGGLLAGLAAEFAERLEAVTREGLVAGYHEAESVSPFQHGRLRAAEQMRDAAAHAFPDRFHVEESVFDLHTPWNRIPKATAAALLGQHDLPTALRQRLEAAAQPLVVLPESPVADADFAAALAEPRAVSYRPLLEVCRVILNGFASADPLGTTSGAFLLDLGRAFEQYLTRSLERELSAVPGWVVAAQPSIPLGPTALQPDIVVSKNGVAWCVLDAKWKLPALDAADLHQALAYATLTGARHVGLVYPGRKWGRGRFVTPDGRVRVSQFRVRVVGSSPDLARSIAKLGRAVRVGEEEIAPPANTDDGAGGE